MNTTQKTDVMWKCLAVSIFSTCAITSCSNDNIKTPSELMFMSASSPVLSPPRKNNVTLYFKLPIPVTTTDQDTAASNNNFSALNVGKTNG